MELSDMISYSVTAQSPALHRQIFALCYELITTITILFSSGFFVAALTGDFDTTSSKTLVNIIPMLLLTAYYAVCWSKTGQSLAQKAWGLKVVDKNGHLLPIGKSLQRVLLAGLLSYLLLGLVFLVVSKKHQPLHDQILRTNVVDFQT